MNHLRPAAGDTPTAFAAAGFCHPAPINLQNSRLSSRRTGGEPSDPSFGRTGLRDFISRHLSISQVLRRLLESGVGVHAVVVVDAQQYEVVQRCGSAVGYLSPIEYAKLNPQLSV
jgi:hypothetical protein